MDSISLWNILGLTILVGPITLSLLTIVAWFLYTAYEDFILRKRRRPVDDAKTRRILIRKSAQPITIQSDPTITVSADTEAASDKNSAENHPEPQTEKKKRDAEKVVQELLLSFIEQSKQFNNKRIS